MKTPLFDSHVKAGARMAPFAGWDMPIQYEGILAEHAHTRTACTVFDTCHMGEFELRGPTALSDLERLLTMRVSTLKNGQCRYGFLLNEAGGVIDDLTCYRLGDDTFWLIVNAGTRGGDFEWVRDHVSADTTLTDLSDDTAKLDVQGPTSRRCLEAAFGVPWPDLGYFRFATPSLGGELCLVSRTGYTGEWGYELYFPAARAAEFWDRLLSVPGVKPAGLGARDTLRLEMAYPLYGHELDAERSPVEFSRGAFIDLNKDFIGRSACEQAVRLGCREYLVGLQLDGRRAARAGDPVLCGGRAVGAVTSGSLAPCLNAAVALAYLEADVAGVGQAVEIAVRGASLSARVVELPFYRNGTARGLPTV